MNLLQHKINRREFEPTKAHPERSVQHSGTEHVLTNYYKLMFFKKQFVSKRSKIGRRFSRQFG